MRSQMFVIIFGIIFLVLIISLLFFISILNTRYIYSYFPSSQKEDISTMLSTIIESYRIENINLTLKQAILYVSLSKNDTINGINVTEIIKNIFDKILNKNWKLIVEENRIINAWVVRVNFSNISVWDYDTSVYPDFEDNFGNKWYHRNFNDSSWIYGIIPFYQGKQIERILGISKRFDLHDIFPDIFTINGLYVLDRAINPLDFLRRFEACFYLNDKYKPKISIENDLSKLPKEIDIGEFAYFNISDVFCSQANNYRELNTSVFRLEKYYNSISNISEMLKSLNKSYDIAVTYMRGYFYVPTTCKEVYLEAIWNELFRLYVNGFFLFATCYNNSSNPPKYSLPIEFCENNPKFPCIRGIPTWGILKANITNYIEKDEINVIAMLFGVPHDENTIPSCFNDIKKYSDISLNTLGSVRIFCINEFGELIELNNKTKLPAKSIFEIGYNPPKNKDLYILQIPQLFEEEKTSNLLIIYSIKFIYW
ncbi:MAG: hypothetical protein QXT85_01150 [Nanopusillaceae archaeon]